MNMIFPSLLLKFFPVAPGAIVALRIPNGQLLLQAPLAQFVLPGLALFYRIGT